MVSRLVRRRSGQNGFFGLKRKKVITWYTETRSREERDPEGRGVQFLRLLQVGVLESGTGVCRTITSR